MGKYDNKEEKKASLLDSPFKKAVALGIGVASINVLNKKGVGRKFLSEASQFSLQVDDAFRASKLATSTRAIGSGITDTFGHDPGLLRLAKNRGRLTDGTLNNRIKQRALVNARPNRVLPTDVSRIHQATQGSAIRDHIIARENQMKSLASSHINAALKENAFSSVTNRDAEILRDAINNRSAQKVLSKNTSQEDVSEFLDSLHHSEGLKKKLQDYSNNKQGYNDEVWKIINHANKETDKYVAQYKSFTRDEGNTIDFMKNTYASQRVQMEALEFNSLMKSTQEAKRSQRTLNLSESGYKPVSMDEATKYTLPNGKTIADSYSLKKVDKLGNFKEYSGVDAFYAKGRKLGYKESDLEQHVFSNQIYINPETGKVLDFTGQDAAKKARRGFIQDNLQVPVMNFNPYDIAQTRTFDSLKEAPSYRLFRAGETLDFINPSKLPTRPSEFISDMRSESLPISEDLVFSHDSVYRMDSNVIKGAKNFQEANTAIQEKLDTLLIEDGLTLAPSSGNIYERLAKGINGASDSHTSNPINDVLGLGQDAESMYGKTKRFFNKFNNPEYGGNLGKNLFASSGKDLDIDSAKTFVGAAESLINNYAENLSSESQNVLNKRLSSFLNNQYQDYGLHLNFDTLLDEESVVSAMAKISLAQNSPNKISNSFEHSIIGNIEDQISQTVKRYDSNAIDFLKDSRTRKTQTAGELVPQFLGGPVVSAFEKSQRKTVSSIEDSKRLLQELAIASARDSEGNLMTIGDLMSNLVSDYGINGQTQKELMALNHHSKLKYFNSKINSSTEQIALEGLEQFSDYYSSDFIQTADLVETLRQSDPFIGYGPANEKTRKIIGDTASYTPIKKHRGLIQSINEQYVNASSTDALSKGYSGVAGTADYFRQFFAGAHDRDFVTTSTAGSYFFADRLDTALTNVGLGLPNHMKGSFQSILMNQSLRRIAMPAAILTGAKLVDGITGDRISDNLADGYVNMRSDVAGISDFTGLTGMKKNIARLFPYANQLTETPLGKAADFLTLGAFGTRDQDEENKYWTSGEDAIRKGRWWGIGSNSPYIGDKIDRYEPNWYRKMKSDYMFSENAYGSEFEYWSNHPMVNPIKHFVTDPYHYENKHKDDRPFAITGGFAELQNIPLIGPAVDSLVSGILKPHRINPKLEKAHEEYLRMYNERLIEGYTSMDSGGLISTSPGGGIGFTGNQINAEIIDEDGEIDQESLDDGVEVGGKSGYVESIASSSSSRNRSFKRQTNAMSSYKGDIRGAISQMNKSLASKNTMTSRSYIASPSGLIDPGTVYDLSSATDKNAFSVSGSGREVLYNISEMGGLFGFLGKSGLSWEEARKNPTLQDSTLMSSNNKKFWDMELGGLGGDISEIFRRYLPRDTARNYYNPIRNTMPGWMPGPEYFTDFLHGDPYSRIAHGEARLPGEAYEKLYNVKKDAEGNYSALDRYRILSDIAPYSDQFRLSKREVSLLSQNGLLSEEETEEYREIRNQVTAKKKKRLFYPTKFIDDKLKTTKETVTVSRVIDANTFLTEEYGNNPLKLAGVQVKSTDTERRNLIDQFIKPGQKLRVELDADPSKRVRKDMMDTMRAVVYTPHGEEGNYFGMYGITKNENLNYALANMDAKQTVSIKDDGSAVATKALYDKSEITVGKISEWTTHRLLPNIPVVGIVADKFMRVQSPVEAYRKDIYSKAWRDWAHPIQDWVIPAAETNIARNPLLAFGTGYGVGRLMARSNKTYWGLGLGLLSGIGASTRALIHAASPDDSVWLPTRRKKERDIDEYFDKLKYIKYSGLYEKAKLLAKSEEGFNLDSYFNEKEKFGKRNKKQKNYLESKKKWLSIDKKSGYGNQDLIDNQLSYIRSELGGIDNDRSFEQVGPYTAMALRYKEQMESTLYGAEDSLDFQKIYRALPAKDRQFFTEFLKASPKEKQEIIRMVPKNQRRIYQQMFNMEVDEKEDLKDFFEDHYLPGRDWEGWQASTSLDDIKVKVMSQEGMTLTEANYWDDDVERAAKSNVSAIEPFTPTVSQNIDIRRLENALRGAGLKDVFVSMQTAPSSQLSFNADVDINQDRTEEVKKGIFNHLFSN
ncbi:hypothetical protein ACFC9N_10520 [Enterococcus casseliflavus]|uniref:hypothetical protein n=1 Tax=Enterococcus casseliflavus TaxID=37734 RepID=UPI0039A63C41